VLSKLIAVIEI